MTVPSIGVTSGDPGGIGPEILVKTLAGASALPPAAYVVFGDPRVIRSEEERLGLRLPLGEWRPGDPAEPGSSCPPRPARRRIVGSARSRR